MDYTNEDVLNIVEKQRKYFKTNQTLPIKFRIKQLKKLKQAMIDYQEELAEGLKQDLGRSFTESYLCDIGSVILEANECIHDLKRWAQPEVHNSGLLCFPSITTKVYKMPYGVSLIVAPYNFPVLLTLGVLLAAISGGNTAVIKVSSRTPYTNAVISKIIKSLYDEEYITVIDGGHDVADYCLNARFDKIFYTGSPKVAKHVLQCASNNLTSVALELGGENGNWCIIRKDANLKDAARKIAFFKSLNAGQVCININQIAVASEVREEFINLLIKEFKNELGEDPINNDEYCKLINQRAYDDCANLATKYQDKIIYGGIGNPETRKFMPTIIYPVDVNDDICNHELFNPLLPIVEFKDNEVDNLLKIIEDREHPLAFYLFTKDMKWANETMASMQFGGGCINEVCVHMMVKGVPFNGTGHSGMGAYHGIWGFREFTHPQTVLKGHVHFNLKLRRKPYNDKKLKLIKMFEK